MDKKILIGAGIVIILVAIAAFVVTKNAEAPVSDTTTDSASSSMTRSSLKELLSLQNPVKCVSTVEDENVSTMSTTYVSGGRIRADIESTDKNTGQKTMMSNVIDSNFMYLWGPEPNKGFKITLDAATQNSTSGVKGSVDLDTALDLDCKDWGVDETLFTPPSSIEFTDMSDILKNAKTAPQATSGDASVSAGGSMCAVCDQAPDATAKADCRVQLNCK